MTLEQKQRANGMLPKSTQMLDEQLDEVKEMNKRAMIGRVTAIRDKQLAENRELEDEYINEQKRMYNMMEIERLKGLIDEEERVKKRQAAAKVGQKVIVD